MKCDTNKSIPLQKLMFTKSSVMRKNLARKLVPQM